MKFHFAGGLYLALCAANDSYWIKLFPSPRTAKAAVSWMARVSRIGNLLLSLPAGNLAIAGAKTRLSLAGANRQYLPLVVTGVAFQENETGCFGSSQRQTSGAKQVEEKGISWRMRHSRD